MIRERTSTSPQVGSYRSTVLWGPPHDGCPRLARIAAPETWSALIAWGRPGIAAPEASVVPMHDSMTQVRQKSAHACQSRDKSPSRTHSSRSEKSDNPANAFVEARFSMFVARRSNSASNLVHAAWSAIACGLSELAPQGPTKPLDSNSPLGSPISSLRSRVYVLAKLTHVFFFVCGSEAL